MDLDLGVLQVLRVIVHEIPRHRKGDESIPALSEVESQLTPELANYFKEKINGSLIKEAFDVVFDPTSASPVPGIVKTELAHPAGPSPSFVDASRTMALHLHSSQNAVNPGGLLVAIEATLGARRALAILKLEKEEGIHLRHHMIGGKRTLNLDHLKELMLTQATKVFKVGLFVRDAQASDALTSTDVLGIEGRVSDKQRGAFAPEVVAQFFLRQFLGCTLRQAPSVTTKRFLQLTEEFINEQVTDPQDKARYQIAVIAELSSERPTISPNEFAQSSMRIGHRAAYIAFLKDRGLPPQTYPKELSLVEPQLKRLQMEFKSGLMLLGRPEAFTEHVRVDSADNGAATVTITDRIARLR